MIKLGKNFSIFFISTLEKEMRSKTLWIILVFTSLLLWLLISFANNSSSDSLSGGSFFESFTLTIVFGFLKFWSYVLAAMFSVGLIRSDEEEGTLKQLLAFPLSRFEYLMARFLGGASIVFFYHLLSTLVAGIGAYEEVISFKMPLLFVLMSVPGMITIIVCGMIFSLFFNRVISLLFIFLWGIMESWSAAIVNRIPFDEVGIFGAIAHGFYWLFPHGFVWSEQAIRLFPPLKESLDVNWIFESGHFCLSFALLFTILIIIFRHRDV